MQTGELVLLSKIGFLVRCVLGAWQWWRGRMGLDKVHHSLCELAADGCAELQNVSFKSSKAFRSLVQVFRGLGALHAWVALTAVCRP